MHLINFSTLNKQHYIISPAVNPCHEQASETSYINLSNLTDYILYHCDKTESMGENQDKQGIFTHSWCFPEHCRETISSSIIQKKIFNILQLSL